MNVVKTVRNLGVGLLAFSLIALPTLETTVAAASQESEYDPAFTAAAQEFNVPEQLLKAMAYNQSRWRSNHGEASIDGGYGIMNLTAKDVLANTPDSSDSSHRHGHGDNEDNTSSEPAAPEQTHYTLNDAAQLLNADPATLKTDQAQNIRGAAADLQKYARDLNDGQLPTNIDDWYDALTAYSGSKDETVAEAYADDVYDVIQSGAYANDDKGKAMSIAPDQSAQPNKNNRKNRQFSQKSDPSTTNTVDNATNNSQGAECPKTLTCRFIPAGYAQNDPNDPTLYGNYDPANRPKDMDIKYIIIHDTEGSYTSAIKHFQDTNAYVSGHYIIRSSDGEITQMVHDKDVSWGADDWYVNMHGINIEHEGFAAAGSQWYTDALYKSSATLVRWLANKYQIPLDRNHIIGHDNVPTTTQAGLAGQHWDPGPFWNWNRYMGLVNGQDEQNLRPVQQPAVASIITMSPDFATNRLTLQDCSTSTTGACVTLPTQGTSVTYLHTNPSDASPLLSDITKHPDGKPGTMEVSDWSASASSGEQYTVAATQGSWVAIWYGGKQGWFNNPASNPVAFRSRIASVTPKAGLTSIPVYGRPVPEASAYPAGVTPLSVTPLGYTIPAKQAYPAIGNLTNDYYYDLTIDYSAPHDHEIFVGNTKYYQIQYNHRFVYVMAKDVDVKGDLN